MQHPPFIPARRAALIGGVPGAEAQTLTCRMDVAVHSNSGNILQHCPPGIGARRSMIVSLAYDKDWHRADCLATCGVDVVPHVFAAVVPRYQPGSWGVGFALRLHGSVFPRAFAP